MSENINESELGRSKKSATPAEHLEHLLTIGWEPSSLLIRKYVVKFGLQNELAQWQKKNEVFSSSSQKVTKR